MLEFCLTDRSPKAGFQAKLINPALNPYFLHHKIYSKSSREDIRKASGNNRRVLKKNLHISNSSLSEAVMYC